MICPHKPGFECKCSPRDTANCKCPLVQDHRPSRDAEGALVGMTPHSNALPAGPSICQQGANDKMVARKASYDLLLKRSERYGSSHGPPATYPSYDDMPEKMVCTPPILVGASASCDDMPEITQPQSPRCGPNPAAPASLPFIRLFRRIQPEAAAPEQCLGRGW